VSSWIRAGLLAWLTTYSRSLNFRADNAYTFIVDLGTACTTDPSPNHWRLSFSRRSGKNVEQSPAGSDVIITTFITIIF